jgi:hypothetical protein
LVDSPLAGLRRRQIYPVCQFWTKPLFGRQLNRGFFFVQLKARTTSYIKLKDTSDKNTEELIGVALSETLF